MLSSLLNLIPLFSHLTLYFDVTVVRTPSSSMVANRLFMISTGFFMLTVARFNGPLCTFMPWVTEHLPEVTEFSLSSLLSTDLRSDVPFLESRSRFLSSVSWLCLSRGSSCRSGLSAAVQRISTNETVSQILFFSHFRGTVHGQDIVVGLADALSRLGSCRCSEVSRHLSVAGAHVIDLADLVQQRFLVVARFWSLWPTTEIQAIIEAFTSSGLHWVSPRTRRH